MNKKKQVKRIFDSISYRYDLLNHVLSAGFDYYWRRKALKITEIKSEAILLDIACGTGDFAIAARKFDVTNITGGDLSLNMLRLFNKKKDWSRGNTVQMIAEQIPLKSEMFTNITVAFGVRNFYDIKKGFDEFFRVLKNRGKVTVLEFRLPENNILKKLYLFYFNKILPLIGRLVSKDKEAYTYLPESVNEFDEKINVQKLLSDSGFTNVKKYNLTFGIVQVVIGEKL